MDVSTWDFYVVESFPQQSEESVDCGIFMLKAMEELALDIPFTFTKDDMSTIRKHMAADIICLSKRTEDKKKRTRTGTCN